MEKKIIICGASKEIREKANTLEKLGVSIYAYTDVKNRVIEGLNFIHFTEIKHDASFFFISFISKRNVRDAIRIFLEELGYKSMKDFVLAG